MACRAKRPGGSTSTCAGSQSLSNLALLCRRHHRAVHEDGYAVARLPDGTLRFTRPDGRPLPDVPEPPPVPRDPVQTLRERHQAPGLAIHPRSLKPTWLGERIDIGWATDVLHPLPAAPRGLPRPGAVGGRLRP
jgi:hypothetical protein